MLLGEAPLLTKGEIDFEIDLEILERVLADIEGTLVEMICDIAVGDTGKLPYTVGLTLIIG